MKKTIILLLLLTAATLTRAQSIDTAFHAVPACKVSPFLYNPRTDSIAISHVVLLSGYFDYAERMITVNYAFATDDQVPMYPAALTITGTDFTAGQTAANKVMYFFHYLASHVPGITYQ
jgi:hypothetical protein